MDDTEEENMGDYFNKGYKEAYNRISSIEIQDKNKNSLNLKKIIKEKD